MKSEHRIKIIENGRCGLIEYEDGKNSLSFDWEFGGGSTVAHIWLREEKNELNEDELSQILNSIGEKIIQEKAKDCSYRIDLQSRALLIIEKEPNQAVVSTPLRAPRSTS